MESCDEPQATPVTSGSDTNASRALPYVWLGALVAGYVGIYLCRKNFSVATPLLQKSFNASRAEIGAIASYSTIAYAVGKFLFGGIVDRVGGRAGLFASLFVVGVMGLAGGLAPSLGMLAIFYSLNRFAGAAAWPAMVKLTPQWFSGRQIPFAMALLSLSFVIGGAAATLLAGQVARLSNGNWRAVMAFPSAVLFVLLLVCWWVIPRTNVAQVGAKAIDRFEWSSIGKLLTNPRFLIVCALSFVLTLLRETFNTWTVDFIKTEGGAEVSTQIAAFLATPFDVLGGFGILAMGWVFGRLSNGGRKLLLFSMLSILAALIYNLPNFFRLGLGVVTFAVGVIGFLTYGPYSLLSGVFALEVGGKKLVGAVSGMVDGVGYLAGILAGAQFGRLVDWGGYSAGFRALAALAAVSAVLCILLQKHVENDETVTTT